MRRDVYKITENGDRVWDCCFVNDFDARYNMISLLMTLYRCAGRLWDAEFRKRFEKEIIETSSNVFFEHNKDVYIMRKID